MKHRDLNFVSGNFLDMEIPKEKQYLLKYFTTDVQRAFLRYCLTFGDVRLFKEHTGYYCSDRLKFRFLSRFRRLVKLHDDAKSSLTEESLSILHTIESGQYPLTGNDFS